MNFELHLLILRRRNESNSRTTTSTVMAEADQQAKASFMEKRKRLQSIRVVAIKTVSAALFRDYRL